MHMCSMHMHMKKEEKTISATVPTPAPAGSRQAAERKSLCVTHFLLASKNQKRVHMHMYMLCRDNFIQKERKKTDSPREGWEDGTPPPHRDFNVITSAHPSKKIIRDPEIFLCLTGADAGTPQEPQSAEGARKKTLPHSFYLILE